MGGPTAGPPTHRVGILTLQTILTGVSCKVKGWSHAQQTCPLVSNHRGPWQGCESTYPLQPVRTACCKSSQELHGVVPHIKV